MTITTVQSEIRVNDWFSVEGKPGWAGSDIVAYRIWQEFDGRRWFQRHEWKLTDGTTRMEDWISGVSGWCLSAKPVAEAA